VVALCNNSRQQAEDGKTSRHSHNRKTGHKALHLVLAFATNSRLVLGHAIPSAR
jgi:hypothetical protein